MLVATASVAKRSVTLIALPLMFLLSGCSHYTKTVQRFDSPTPDLFYTEETGRSDAPLASDGVDVYVNWEHGGKTDRELVLHGLYVEVKSVAWISVHEGSICVPSGNVAIFNGEVELHVGKQKLSVKTNLPEHC